MMESSSVYVGRPVEKKLRKRKELDAILAKKSHRAHSSQELLRNLEDEDESESSMEEERPKICPESSGVSVRRSWTLLVQACGGLMVVLGVGGSFMVVFTLFTLHVQMKVEIAAFATKLEKVVEERNDLREKYQSLHSQIQEVLSNQTELRKNLSSTVSEMAALSNQAKFLNISLNEVAGSLKAAPELKNLPSDVESLRNSVAQFGSRLAEFEMKINKMEETSVTEGASMRGSFGGSQQKFLTSRDIREDDTASITSVLNNTEQLRLELDVLERRLNGVGTSIATQLQKEEERSAKSWELIANLENRVQNISEQVSSLDQRCSKNDAKLSSLEIHFNGAPTSISTNSHLGISSSNYTQDNQGNSGNV